ncbi:MAG: hypothetical protein QM704_11235 [Anaeromyxobacteraceae bacterium]
MKPALLSLLLALAAPAAADGPQSTAAQGQDALAPGKDAPGQRVKASHRVDVIAPGERVETVIDRLRAARPQATGAAEAPPSADRPVRPPDGRAGGEHDRAGARGGREGHEGMPPPGTAPPGTAPPPMGSHGERQHR